MRRRRLALHRGQAVQQVRGVRDAALEDAALALYERHRRRQPPRSTADGGPPLLLGF